MVGTEPERFEARLLADAARRFAYPPTPDLRARTVARVAALGQPSRARPARRRLAFAAVAAVLALLALTLALPDGRRAVAEFFGLVEGERIERLAPGPTPSMPAVSVGATGTPARSPAATATPSPIRPDQYAERVTMETARAALGFEPALPPDLGPPDAVYLAVWGRQPLLILEYPRFDLWQTRGGGFVGKGLPEEAQVDIPSVSGEPAYWVDSGPYSAAFYDAGGNEVHGSRRTITSKVLIWRGAESYYRLETELSLEQALAIAESLP
jgi:hypothetical protein